MVNGKDPEVPALGAGLVTVTNNGWLGGVTAVNSAAGTVTTIVVGETEVGIRILEPKFTSAPLTKPEPVMVKGIRSPLPARAIGGESRVIVTGQLQGADVTVNGTA